MELVDEYVVITGLLSAVDGLVAAPRTVMSQSQVRCTL